MKKTQTMLLSVLLALTATSATALERNTKMGKPTDEELRMTQYEAAPEADAVVLYSDVDARFDFNPNTGDFQLVYYCKMRIKVLTAEGVKAGDVSLSYFDPESTNDDEEKILGLKVTTYNLEDGKVVRTRMDNNLQNKERVDKNNCLLKFAAPNVKVGSIIEYEYRLQSDYYYSPNTWYAQDVQYPVFYTTYSILVPEWFTFSCYPSGIQHLDAKQTPDNFTMHLGGEMLHASAMRHSFAGSELPALRDADFVFCIKDYSTRVEHELKSIQIPGSLYRSYNVSWGSLAHSLYDDTSFGGRLKMDNPLAAQQQALGLSPDQPVAERVEALRQLLLSQYKWDGSYNIWGASKRQIRNDKDHELNMGTLDFIMLAMLRDAGIPSHPMVMSRRSKGRLPIYPSSRYFNAMAIRIDTSDSTCLYLDPTAEGYPVGVLPPDMLVNHALVIYPDRAVSVNLSHSAEGRTLASVKAQISADGLLQGNATMAYRQESAGAFRQAYLQAKDSAQFAQRRVTDDEVEITSYTLTDAHNNAEQVREDFTFTRQLQIAADRIYLNPFLFVDMASPFTAESRHLPIEWPYAASTRCAINIDIPEGYVIEELPHSKTAKFDENMYVRVNIADRGTSLMITVNTQRQNTLIPAEQYNEVRSYYADIEAAMQEMVVLKKVAP